jgi:hypothetical protein
MTNRCFSSSQLYALRNDINVQMLIEKTLHIPCRVTKGCFRFLCPLCSGYDTAVNTKTNLARCFGCGKNFNTIDLVMLVRQAKFVDSVRFLQSIHQQNPVCRDPAQTATIAGSNLRDVGREQRKTPSGKSSSGPCQIGDIMGSILPLEHDDIPENKPEKSERAQQNDAQGRMEALERQLEHLNRQIRLLARTITASRPTK